MTPELSPELRRAMRQLDAAEPLRVVDPDTNAAYVIVKADVFERMRRLIGDEDPRGAYPLIAAVMREDDERDPLLASYQSLRRDAERP